MEKITEQLKELGLGDYEALVYGTLLETSPANATLLARKCNLSRSSVYTTLNSLIGKGLVGTTYKNEVKQFVAEDHTALGNILKKEERAVEQKFKTLDQIQKTLQTFSKNHLHVPKITSFEGQEGLQKIYLSMMRQARPGSTLYLLRDEFVWDDSWKFIFEMDWHERVKRMRSEKNITTKLLINDSTLEQSKAEFYKSRKGLEYRMIPEENKVSRFALYAMDDTVSLLSMEQGNLVGIQITNHNIADNMKNMFELLWERSGN